MIKHSFFVRDASKVNRRALVSYTFFSCWCSQFLTDNAYDCISETNRFQRPFRDQPGPHLLLVHPPLLALFLKSQRVLA